MYIYGVHLEVSMPKEKIMPFVEARAKLSEIVTHVAEHGDTYVVAKRQKPVAVIIGIDRYRQLSGSAKRMRDIAGRRLLDIEGMATAVEDIDQAIRALRKSRLAAAGRSL
jgi:prevent-host-death family protein